MRIRDDQCPGIVTSVLYFSVILVASFGLIATPAQAEHFNRAKFVPSFEACDPALANTATSNGVPACTPSVPTSNCVTDLETALIVSAKGGGAITYRHSGRRETKRADGAVDFLTKVVLKGVLRCSGERFTGDVTLATAMRMYRDDPVCGIAGCVLPEFTLVETIPCKKGRCKLFFSGNAILTAAGKPPFPSDHMFTSFFPTLKILDTVGRPFLTVGLQAGDRHPITLAAKKDRIHNWFTRLLRHVMEPSLAHAYVQTLPGRAALSLSRYVQAYEPCDPSTADLVTADGLAACTPVPLSNCSSDPSNAVRAVVNIAEDTNTGRGKIFVKVKDQLVKITGDVAGIENCNGTPYTGPLQLDVLARVTVDDPACGSDPCTTVETTLFGMPIDLTNGHKVIRVKQNLNTLGPFPGLANSVTAELTTGRMLDKSGNIALISPSILVRCSQHTVAAGTPFCFSN